jgi:FkbM family methyltransferase
MQRLVKDVAEPVIFHVGAHVGHTAREFRKLFPTSTVHAFEPFRESFEELDELARRDPAIIAHDFGLSDSSGVRDFHSNPSSQTNSLLATDERGPSTWHAGLMETKEIVSAQFETLDAFVSANGIRKIDILKLDAQGAESLVMAGAVETCRRAMIDVIYTEIITQPTYEGQKRFDECLKSFYESGFDLCNLYNLFPSSEGRLIQVDALFMRNGA